MEKLSSPLRRVFKILTALVPISLQDKSIPRQQGANAVKKTKGVSCVC